MSWHLNQNDADAVRISDPHLQQTPRFSFRCTHYLDTGCLKALMFGSEIPNLYPQGEIAGFRPIPDAGDLQETST